MLELLLYIFLLCVTQIGFGDIYITPALTRFNFDNSQKRFNEICDKLNLCITFSLFYSLCIVYIAYKKYKWTGLLVAIILNLIILSNVVTVYYRLLLDIADRYNLNPPFVTQ